MNSSPIVDSILSARYLRAGEKSFEDICHRVAAALAADEAEAARFYEAMASLRFLPNSPTLMNAGTEIGQLSACFTLPVPDSIGGIFDAMKQGAIIHKTGGGTGYNFSNIRPEGSPVQSTEGVASGPISFMRVFNAATEVIKQGGRRRGANMGILNVQHPDILAFINAKTREGEIANFNISVMVDDAFMHLVSEKTFDKVWLVHPHTGEAITVGQIWSGIVDGIWKNGEPGILFYDEINRHNPTPQLGMIDTTNPCGEQPLLPYESCVLGSINLAACVKGHVLDEDLLKETVRTGVRLLDIVIDKNVYPIEEIAEATRTTRKIGLGLMGVHDALLMVRLPYDSPEARVWCEHVMKVVSETAVDESRVLAELLGPFPALQGSVWTEFQVRNAAMTTIAPTGTISLLAGCSSGIEPIFSFAYTRKNTVGKTFLVVNPVFKEALEETLALQGYSGDDQTHRVDEVIAHVHETGTVQDLVWLPVAFRRLCKTALDIPWRDHVEMQAAFQREVHASISKTINMPKSATRDDCAEALLLAWRLGLKGITIYRTNSREDVVLTLKEAAPSPSPVAVQTLCPAPTVSISRPKELSGRTYLCQSGCCSLYVTVNLLNQKPIEVFIRTVGSGCEANSNALGRAISTGLQNGVPYHKFVKQFAKVNCVSAIRNPSSEGFSCADVVGRCIELSATNQSITTLNNWQIRKTDQKRLCPECQEPLDFGEGCNKGTCKNCGWSGCS
ncbi:adenosylcobalamin-dependent ribonucleoside-diphosphate reductase [Methanosphaerula palustris]|uniref:Vitamin B12-dependent ribonucleotide reductase n=1 Tax=Methanosphaerula palustris (strain ATCC BAA-1556 / DSM 19958 / E1-9c) TaxID=521011 RepID=B8GF58_METPE|nr:adenosylcobalamin-dependent ribonucleoside-diphosphate reductase [Methanosphaerula palustris]ACL17864.1 ribonucleoside-diphosphate reductase, adenosylcobalamin-dependent [Methanosphaerula palustris E1-9c]